MSIKVELEFFTPTEKIPDTGRPLLWFNTTESECDYGYFDGAYYCDAYECLYACEEILFWAYAPTKDELEG